MSSTSAAVIVVPPAVIEDDRCPECGSSDVVEDPHEGKLVCHNCGRIIGGSIISTESEWRSFADDDRGGADPNRVGGIEIEGGAYNFGLSTTIGKGADGSTSALAHIQSSSALGGGGGKSLMDAFDRAHRYGSALQLGANIIDRANDLYRNIVAAGEKLRRRDVSVCACLLIASQIEGFPRSIKEIVSVTGNVNGKAVNKLVKKLKRLPAVKHSAQYQVAATGTSVSTSVSASALVERYCSQLTLSNAIQRTAVTLVEQMDKHSIMSGRAPQTIAAVAIYLASLLQNNMGMRRSFTDIAAVTGAAETTIKLAWKKVYEIRNSFIPPSIASADVLNSLPQ